MDRRQLLLNKDNACSDRRRLVDIECMARYAHHVLHVDGLIHGERGLFQGSGKLSKLRQQFRLVLLLVLQLLRGEVLSYQIIQG